MEIRVVRHLRARNSVDNASAIFIPSKLTLLIVILQLARNEEKKLTSMKISIGRQILHFPKKKKKTRRNEKNLLNTEKETRGIRQHGELTA